MPIERDRKLTIRIAEDELLMLQALADADGLSVSDILRQFARKTYRDRFGERKPRRVSHGYTKLQK